MWEQGVLLTNLAATLVMVGLIWFVQVVHYPLMRRVGLDGYQLYQREHMARTTWVVAPPMLIEMATAIALVVRPLPACPAWAAWTGLGLVILIWASTALLQAPQHDRLARAFDAGAHRLLVTTNGLRTAAWTARAALMLWLVWRVLAA